MATRTLVVTPTYNERDNLAIFTAAVRGAMPDAHILVVDDASPDGTGDMADELAAADSHVHVMHRPGKMGLGTAYVQAFEWGLEQGYDRFFEMDADLSHDVQYLPDFVRALDDGADAVIGSRNVPGGGVRGWGPLRHVISKGGSLYSRTILGLDVHDLTSGYKAFSRRALEAIDLDRMFARYGYPNDLLARLGAAGLRVEDAPVRPVYGPAWRSGISLWTVIYPISFVLLRSAIWRLWRKHVGRLLAARASRTIRPALSWPAVLAGFRVKQSRSR